MISIAAATRMRRFLHGVASSYAVLFAGALYSLGSVPLALHFLSKQEFGLWALVVQIAGYMTLIDLGMSSSAARLLIDYKDAPNAGPYGSLIQTGFWVMLAQSGIVVSLGVFFSPALSHLLSIPANLQAAFVTLMRWQCVIAAGAHAMRIFSHVLYAHQRSDLINYSLVGSSVVTFLVLWLFLVRRWGVYSIIWANAFGSLPGVVLPFWICRLRHFLPAKDCWGRPTWLKFRELFSYGKDVFLISVGAQLIIASQPIIITRVMGLGAVAVWSVTTKTYSLVSQLIWRFFDFSVPAFSEMLVRHERERLRLRFSDLVIATASGSAVAAVLFALCNQPFVLIWTGGRISWPPVNDLLLGVWLVILSLVHCHGGLVLVTKEIRFMRYVFFLEGAVFVLLAVMLGRWGGFPSIIASSILCSVLFSGSYGVWRTHIQFGDSLHEVALGWLRPMGRVVLVLVPAAILSWWIFHRGPAGLALIGHLLAVGFLGAFLFLRWGISKTLQVELRDHAPQKTQRFLARVMAIR